MLRVPRHSNRSQFGLKTLLPRRQKKDATKEGLAIVAARSLEKEVGPKSTNARMRQEKSMP